MLIQLITRNSSLFYRYRLQNDKSKPARCRQLDLGSFPRQFRAFPERFGRCEMGEQAHRITCLQLAIWRVVPVEPRAYSFFHRAEGGWTLPLFRSAANSRHEHRERLLWRLLFGAAIVITGVSLGLAGRDNDIDMDTCKMCSSGRSPAASNPPPALATQNPVCRWVKERVGTRHGHAVYQNRQVCR